MWQAIVIVIDYICVLIDPCLGVAELRGTICQDICFQ